MTELTVLLRGRGKKWERISKISATDYNKCIICQEKTSESLYNFTTCGYGSLLFVIQNRDDACT